MERKKKESVWWGASERSWKVDVREEGASLLVCLFTTRRSCVDGEAHTLIYSKLLRGVSQQDEKEDIKE